MAEFKLNDTEDILPDDYPVYYGYIYIADMKPIECKLDDSEWEQTVADLKRVLKVKEVRRCDLFSHDGMTMADTFIL